MNHATPFTVKCELCRREREPKDLRYVIEGDILLCIDVKGCTLARTVKPKQAAA